MKRLLVIAAALAFLASGCGGGDDSDATAQGGSDSAPSVEAVEAVDGLTKAELIAQADAICEEADKKQEAALKAYLKKNPNAESDPKGKVQLVKQAGLPPIRTEVEEIAALGAPAGEVDQVQSIVDGLQQALEEGEKNPESLLGNSPNPFEASGKQAAKYGFKACSSAL
jgi:hypothetical protein